MNHKKKLLALALVLGLSTQIETTAYSYSLTEGQAAEAQAREAIEAGELRAALLAFKAALAYRPNHPGYLFNIAYLEMNTGAVDEALATLGHYAALGLYTDLDRDIFSSIQGLEGFAAVKLAMDANKQPWGQVESAFVTNSVIPLAEGVAYDSKRDIYYLSSIHGRAIYRVTGDGNAAVFITHESNGMNAASGLHYDAVRDLIWLASPVAPQMGGFNAALDGTSAIFAFNAETGAVVHRFVFSATTETKYYLGDLAILPDGRIAVTNSVSNQLMILNEEGMVQQKINLGNAASLQGVAADEGGQFLYVADYSSGIHRVNLTDGTSQLLEAGSDQSLLGVDGLYYYSGGLIAIQNGVNPNRVMRLELAESGDFIVSARVLAANIEGFEEPTLGVVKDNAFLFVANSQWPRFANPAQITAEIMQGLEHTRIMRIPLN